MKSTLLSISLLLFSTTLANPILLERDTLSSALNEPSETAAPVTESATVPIATASLAARAPEPKKSNEKSSSAAAHHTSSKKPKKASSTLAKSKKTSKTDAVVGTLPSATPKPGEASVSGTEATNLPSANGGVEPTSAKSASAVQATAAKKVTARAAAPEPKSAKSKAPSFVVSAKKSAAKGGADVPVSSKAASQAPKVTARDALPDPEAEALVGPIEVYYPKHKTTLSTSTYQAQQVLPSSAPVVEPVDTPTSTLSYFVFPTSSGVAKREAEAAPIVIPPEPIEPKKKSTVVYIEATPTFDVLPSGGGILASATPTASGLAKREAEAAPIVGPNPEVIYPEHKITVSDVKATPTYVIFPNGLLEATATGSGIAKREAFHGGPGREGDHNIPHGEESASVGGPEPTVTGS